MPHLDLEQAHALVCETLIRCHTAPGNARAVADALVAAEQAGQGGHGLRRVPSYAAQALSGKVDGHAVPCQDQPRPGLLAVDACNGFAYPALDLAIAWLIETAPRQGLAAAGITRSHHCGVAGVTVARLADAGLVAIMFANAPAAIAPWGGRNPFFGTDPIAFAAPRAQGKPPIVVDLSLSKVARGKVMAAAQRNEPIPEGWALDSDGNPTTDPQAALAGTMIPMGDSKGTALALMVEMLAAGLLGAHFGYEASSFFSPDGPPPGVGQLILAIDPGAFGARGSGDDAQMLAGSALRRFEDIATRLENEPGARLPGARRFDLKQQVEKEGIWLDAQLLEQIHALGVAATPAD